jgi:hypothetical protein
MSKNINFRGRSKTEFDLQIKPYPAVKSLPKWYLDSDPYLKNASDVQVNNDTTHVRKRELNHNFKKCTPLLDGMGAGYIVPLWSDVEVDNSNPNFPAIYWKTRNDVFEAHGMNTREIDPPPGYHPQVFKYLNCWIPQTPKGYSCLVVSPIGHNNLVFNTVPAIVDTDSSMLELPFPLWVKNDFNGIVEKGTPIAQIIPFKRDDWESTFDYYEDGEYIKIIEEKNFNTTIVGNYIKNHWSKKKFK